MAQSTNDVIPTAMRLAALADAARAARRRSTGLAAALLAQGRGVRRHHQVGPHPPAGRDADPARPGVHRLRPHGRAAPRRSWREAARLAARDGHRRHRGGHRDQRRAGVSGADGQVPARGQRARAARGRGPHPADAVDGRHRHVQRRVPRVRARSQQDRQRHPAAGLGAAHRPRRDPAAGGAARLEHHAGQGESVDRRDGEPGVLPGAGPRHHRRDGRRGGPARAQRDDAGHRPQHRLRA